MNNLYSKISDPWDRHQAIRARKAYDEGGFSAYSDVLKEGLYSDLTNVSIVGTSLLFPGSLTQLARLPTFLRGGMTARVFFSTYGGNLSPFPSLGIIALGELYSHINKSRGQDKKSGTSVPSVLPRTPRGTKPSRRASPGKTSKPFWSNGKPKCKKGFRYDFKRKLCVKIK